MPTAFQKDFIVDNGLDVNESIKINEQTVTSFTDSARVSSIAREPANANAIALAGGASSKTYDSADLLPLSGNDSGDFGYVASTNRLYLWNGAGWYSIAIVNLSPSVVSPFPDSNYAFDSVGASAIITLNATDPEEAPLTYTYVASDSASDLVSISQVSNVFTVSSLTQSQLDSNGKSDGGSFSITFRASDGVNIAPFVSAFTLSFSPTWTGHSLGFSLQSSSTSENAFFGENLEIDGNYAVIGARGHGPSYTGKSFIFFKNGSTWEQQQELTISDGSTTNFYGQNVSISGNTAAVTSTGGNGACYIFTRSATPAVGGLNDASYVHKSPQTWQSGMSGDANATQPHTLAFKPDGTKAYIADANSDLIYQYSLSTPYVVTDASMSYDSVSFNLRTSTGNSANAMLAASMKFKPDGTKLFVLNEPTDTVYEYDLSTAYDLSTISYNNKNIAIGSVEGFPEGIFFKPDGTKMYVIGTQNDSVRMMDLSTAWDVTTATYNSSNTFSVSSQNSEPMEVIFDSSGTKMYMVGQNPRAIYSYTLSTAWDVTTASYDSQSYSMASGTDVNGQQKSIALSADTGANKLFVVGITRDEVNRIDLPVVYWTQQTKLSAPTASSGFGQEVSLVGDKLVVGMYGYDSGGNTDIGRLVSYTRSGTTWSSAATIDLSDGVAGDMLGYDSFRISEDGNYLIVGVTRRDNSGNTDEGVAYIFYWNGSAWTQQAKLEASDGAAGFNFGNAVAITDKYAAVGALMKTSETGAVYIFTRSGTTWTQRIILGAGGSIPSDLSTGEQFGYGIDVHKNSMVISAGNRASPKGSGHAYVFTTSDEGVTWTQRKKFTTPSGDIHDNYGCDSKGVAIDETSETVVVGAGYDDTGNTAAGKVYFYKD